MCGLVQDQQAGLPPGYDPQRHRQRTNQKTGSERIDQSDERIHANHQLSLGGEPEDWDGDGLINNFEGNTSKTEMANLVRTQ